MKELKNNFFLSHKVTKDKKYTKFISVLSVLSVREFHTKQQRLRSSQSLYLSNPCYLWENFTRSNKDYEAHKVYSSKKTFLRYLRFLREKTVPPKHR